MHSQLEQAWAESRLAKRMFDGDLLWLEFLVCPICGNTNVHFDRPVYEESGSHIDLLLGMRDENGHTWQLELHYWGGNTQYRLVDTSYEEE